MFIMINAYDLLMILFLIFMEGILSLDNAVVLAVTVKHLPPHLQKKALSYGIWSAFAFRFIALFGLNHLMKFTWIKGVGAGYLLWVGLSHFIIPSVVKQEMKASAAGFWRTILIVELLDLTFSMDSIFAAVGVSSNMLVVFIGGVLGIVMMRFAATLFIKLIERFHQLESFAYGLVIAIGVRLGFQAITGL